MRKLVLGMAALLTVAACAPGAPGSGAPSTTAAPPTTAAGLPHVPQISSFTASTTSAPSPLTTALKWTVSDPDGDALLCRLDLDDDGSFDVIVNPCTSSSRTRTFTAVGTTTVVLSVTDGTYTSTASLDLAVGSASSDAFGITLRMGSMTVGQTNAFDTAAAKWASIIRTGQPDRTVSIGANYCASGTAAFSGTVDDLLIDAQIISIDGPGGILGQAGPCLVRASNGIPLYGIMQFDSADVAGLETSGQLANTIVHEMGHILGIGTIWSSKGVLVGAGTSNPTFVGAAGVGAWRELGGAGDIPVENSGGSGTVDSHWRETVFKTELMTGYLNSTNQLSVMTAASLADLGYGVDMSGADAYTLPASLRAMAAADGVHQDAGDRGIVTVLPRGSA